MAADIVNIPVSTKPAQGWTGVRGSTDTVLVWNSDTANTVYVGFQTNVSVDSPSAIPVPPNGSFNLPASRNIWVVGLVQGVAPLVIIPDATGMFRSLTQGLGALAIPAIYSPNFNLANPSASPANSWALLQNGLAYVFGLVIQGGTITGPDYIIDPTGFYIYAGTPAFGNLIESHTTYTPGNPINFTTLDPIGLNAVLAGDVSYSVGPLNITATQIINGSVNWLQAAGSAGPYAISAQLFYSASGGLGLVLASAPFHATAGSGGSPSVIYNDAWTNLAPVVTGYVVSVCRYRIGAEKMLWFDLQMRAGAGAVAGTYNLTLTLPGSYQPLGTLARSYPLGYNGVLIAGNSAGSLLVDEASSANAGRVRVQVAALPVNTDVGCTVSVPVD